MLWVRPLVRVLAKSLVLSSLRNEFKQVFAYFVLCWAVCSFATQKTPLFICSVAWRLLLKLSSPKKEEHVITTSQRLNHTMAH